MAKFKILLSRAVIAGAMAMCAGMGWSADEATWIGPTAEGGTSSSAGANWNVGEFPSKRAYFFGGTDGKTVVFDQAHQLNDTSIGVVVGSKDTASTNLGIVVWQASQPDFGISVPAVTDHPNGLSWGLAIAPGWDCQSGSLRIESGTYSFAGIHLGWGAPSLLDITGGTVVCTEDLFVAKQKPGEVIVEGQGQLNVSPEKCLYVANGLYDDATSVLRVKTGGVVSASFIGVDNFSKSAVILDGGTIVKNGLNSWVADNADARWKNTLVGDWGNGRGYGAEEFTVQMTENGGTLQCDYPIDFVAKLSGSGVLTKTGSEYLAFKCAVEDTIGMNVQSGTLKVLAGAQFASLAIAADGRVEIDCSTEASPYSIVKTGGTISVPSGTDPSTLIALTGTYAGNYVLAFDESEGVCTGIRVVAKPETAIWDGPAAGEGVTDAMCAVSVAANWNPDGTPTKVWRFEGGSAGKVVAFDSAVTMTAWPKINCNVQVGDPSESGFTEPVVWRATGEGYGFADLSGGVYIADGTDQSDQQLKSGWLRIESGYYKAGGNGNGEPKGLAVGKYGSAKFDLVGGTFSSLGDVNLAGDAGGAATVGSNEEGATPAHLEVAGNKWLFVSASGSAPGSLTVHKSGKVSASYIKFSKFDGSELILDGGTLVKNGNTDSNYYYGSREVPLQLTANGGTLQADSKCVMSADIVDADTESVQKGTFVKTGAQDLVFTAQKGYTGATEVREGRLVIPAGVHVGSGLTMSAGTKLVIDFSGFAVDGEVEYTLVSDGGTVVLPDGTSPSDMVEFANAGSFDLTAEVTTGGNVVIRGQVKDELAVARIGSVNYSTLGGAMAAVKEGETVVLLKDVLLEKDATAAAALTLDLNGHVVTRLYLNPSLSFPYGGTLMNGTLAVDASLGANPGGGTTDRASLVSVGEGKTLTVTNVNTGDANGHEPFSMFYLRKKSRIEVTGGTWHAATLMSCYFTGNDTGNLVISGGRFYIRGWHIHYSNGSSEYQNAEPIISGGSFSLPPKAQWLANGYVILHDVTDTETPYHVVPEASAPYTELGWRYHYADGESAVRARVAKRTTGDGEKFYTSLADAVGAAQSGETVSLVSDITALDSNVAVAEGKTLTIDGNGHLVKVRNPFVSESGYVATDFTLEFRQMFYVWNGCDVTLRNMQLMGGGITKASDNNNGSYAVENVGTLLLDNVTITRSNGAVMNQGGARLFVNNCRLVRNCRFCAGGIFNYGFAVLNRSSLSENRSLSTGGGGGATENGGAMYINNCVICNNSSTEIGGAINNYHTGNVVSLYMMNTTVSGNFSAANSWDNGGGVGLRSPVQASFFSVNNLFCNNYQIQLNAEGGPVLRESDIKALDYSLKAGSMTNELYYTVYCAYNDIGDGRHVSEHNRYVEANSTSVFSGYYATTRIYQNNIGTTMPVNGARLVSKDDGSLNADLARYAPILRTVNGAEETYGEAVLGADGVYTYFDASGWKNGVVKMSYATVQDGARIGERDKAGAIVALGDLQPADAEHMVTDYYELAGARSFGVAGASGWSEDEKVYHTIRLAGEVVHGTVTGITLYGDTYEEGTAVTLTATPGVARTFLGWFVPGEETPRSTDTVWNLTVVEDLVLEPRFSEVSEMFTPSPKVHVKMQGAAEAPLFPITVTTAWMLQRYPDIEDRLSGKTTEEQESILTGLLEVVDADTGLKLWQDYVLGITPGSKNAALWIDSPQYSSVGGNLIRFKMNDLAPVSGSGFDVRYRLDKKLGTAVEFVRDVVNATGVFDVNVATDPTGLYVIDLLFVPTGEATSEEFVTTVNTAGVLRVATAAERAALSVPWTKLAPSGTYPVDAVSLVKTMNLTTGDRLFVYDGSQKSYRAFQLRDSGTWEALAVYSISESGGVDWTAAVAAKDSSVARGAGFWLERQNTEDFVYLVGQVDATSDAVTTPLSAGWNLVGSPATSEFDFSELQPTEGDRIVVPTAGEPKNLTWQNESWGYYKNTVFQTASGRKYVKPVWTTTDNVVPVGTAFWYIRENSGEVSIYWSTKEVR